MKIDIHCHAIGKGRDIANIDREIFFKPEDNQHYFTRILYNLLEEDLIKMEGDLNRDGTISTGEYFDLLYKLLGTSEEIDGIVLLALDAVYSPKTGILDERETDLWVSNRFLSEKVDELNKRFNTENIQGKRFYFGASVSPNRKDREEELDFVFTKTDAVMVKLIPSTQHIKLMDERHVDFYKALAENNMPLLCHVGPEYSFPEGIRNKQLDNFKHLEKPLENGVTVIAAHCASPVFPIIDTNVMKDFYKFMKDANAGGTTRLWADTSALSLSTRLPFIPEILETFPSKWLVHGSDFPIPIDSWPHLPLVTHDITPEEYIEIYKTKSPFDRDVRIKRSHGFSDSILENAENVLRLKAHHDTKKYFRDK